MPCIALDVILICYAWYDIHILLRPFFTPPPPRRSAWRTALRPSRTWSARWRRRLTPSPHWHCSLLNQLTRRLPLLSAWYVYAAYTDLCVCYVIKHILSVICYIGVGVQGSLRRCPSGPQLARLLGLVRRTGTSCLMSSMYQSLRFIEGDRQEPSYFSSVRHDCEVTRRFTFVYIRVYSIICMLYTMVIITYPY